MPDEGLSGLNMFTEAGKTNSDKNLFMQKIIEKFGKGSRRSHLFFKKRLVDESFRCDLEKISFIQMILCETVNYPFSELFRLMEPTPQQ